MKKYENLKTQQVTKLSKYFFFNQNLNVNILTQKDINSLWIF